MDKLSGFVWKAIPIEDPEISLREIYPQRAQRPQRPPQRPNETVVNPDRGLKGLKKDIRLRARLAITVLIVNFAVLIWQVVKGSAQATTTMYQGSCKKARSMDIWVHALINILSTCLLAASNYCMQYLSAPTRPEVDNMHKRRRWMDIGIPSMHNLQSIPRSRVALWCTLAITSLSIHLLYNASVFSTIVTPDYIYTTVTEDFQNSGISQDSYTSYWGIDPSTFDDVAHWESLSNEECISTYLPTLALTKNRNLLLVTSSAGQYEFAGNFPLTQPYTVTADETVSWPCVPAQNYTIEVCDTCCTPSKLNPNNWTVSGYPIVYCLSQPFEEECRLQVSTVFLLIVTISSAIKVSAIFLTIRVFTLPPLATLGDAISSYLHDPEPITKGMCTIDRRQAVKGWPAKAEPKLFHKKKQFWWKAASLKRAVFANLLGVVCLGVISGLLFMCITGTAGSTSLKALWADGFGSTTQKNAEGNLGSVNLSLLITNLPQLLVTWVYVSYNYLLTAQLANAEWSLFSTHRQPLRVTNPKGQQRRTHYLQLPYSYAIPFLVASGLIHWMTSQSFLFVRVVSVSLEGVERDSEISGPYYSCIAMIFLLIISTLVVVAAFANGFRRYDGMMPVGATCSVCVSAACHNEEDPNKEAFLSPIGWGDVSGPGNGDEVRHLTFTSMFAQHPLEGTFYS